MEIQKMRPEAQIKHTAAIRSYIRATLSSMIREQKPQREILQNIHSAINDLPEYPRSLARDARQYFDGYYDALTAINTCFLYEVDGLFYSVSSSKDTGFPSWDTLPRECWDDLGQHGAIRYNVAPFNVFS